MSGATRTIQQPARTGSISTAVGLIALIAAVAFAVAVSAAGRATSQVSAPAPLYAPAVRDLGARDLGTTTQVATPNYAPAVRDLGARDLGSSTEVTPKLNGDNFPATVGATVQPLGYHGFGGQAPALTTNGSNQAAPAVHRPGLRPS